MFFTFIHCSNLTFRFKTPKIVKISRKVKKLFILFSFCPYFLMGQFEINFEEGLPADMEQFPVVSWSVCNDNPLEGNYSLCHSFDNSENGTDIFSFFHEELDSSAPFSMEFLIQYNYKPSLSNNWAVYLLSLRPAMYMSSTQKNTALILGVNQESSDDLLKLYVQRGKNIAVLCSTGFNWETEVNQGVYKFLVQYTPKGELIIKGALVEEEYVELAVIGIPSSELPVSNYFGLKYSYTASKDRLLKFDGLRIKGSFIKDSSAPKIEKLVFVSRDEVHLFFDEDVFPTDSFSCRFGNQNAIASFDENRIILELANELTNGMKYDLILDNFCDKKMNTDCTIKSFEFFLPKMYDVVFTELMYDPSPPVYLPEADYLEIYNKCANDIHLTAWKIKAGLKEWVLPDRVIRSGSYLVVSQSDLLSFLPDSVFCKVEGTSNFLTNSGEEVFLLNERGDIIDACRYKAQWYSDDFKSNGGWSLEKSDINNECDNRQNWKFSIDGNGGSPGYANPDRDIFIDSESPYLKRLIMIDSFNFILKFNKGLSPDLLLDNREMHSGSGMEYPDSIYFNNIFRDEIILKLNSKTVSFAREFNWKKEISDCSGNISVLNEVISCRLPQIPAGGDVLFSEILFATYPGCPEFIEIYNASKKVISLEDLHITFFTKPLYNISKETIAEEKALFFPGEYLCLSRNPDLLKNYYEIKFPGRLFQALQLCSLSAKGGRLALHSRNGTLIDEIIFSAKDHFPMLTDSHGVSLERIRMDQFSGLQSEWHSASSLSGYATPGYRNSQAHEDDRYLSSFSIEKEIFSPNNDGIDDIAYFTFSLDREGYIGNFRIFDASGRLVRIVANNALLGPEGSFAWDGLDESGGFCPSGIYLGYLEVFHLSGKKKKFRQSVVLNAKGSK